MELHITPRVGDSRMPNNTPIYSLASTALMLAVGVTLVLSGQAGDKGGLLLMGVLLANLPGTIGAIYAERGSRDIRNGTLPEQTRKGIEKAVADGTLQEGVSQALTTHQVVTRDGPLAQHALDNSKAVQAQTAALVKLLETLGPTPTPRTRTPRKRTTERKR